MKKNFLAIALCFLLAIFPFSACDAGNNGGNNGGDSTSDAPILCTVKFEMPDGTFIVKNVYYGESLTDIPAVPVLNEEGSIYAWSVVDFSSITSNITVTLIKVALTYTITYDTEEISDVFIEKTSQSVEYGKPYSLLTPSRVGYKFMGWEDADGNPFTSGTAYAVQGDVTLKAVWEEDHSGKIYTITYDLEGIKNITIARTSQQVEYGKPYVLETPTRPTYEFVRWVDENGNTFESGESYSLTRNVTLKAVWVEDGGWSDSVIKPSK